ncbi:methionine ABC transporter ATP-binding protein MetN [Flavobacterium sp. DG1-102-2]|uniref:methionine ABC transporter ATP-binding protein MetN n=1 Tax=Flavobacterium sp. DG1-102-2 TaxID=3081663 RepID=UPI0029496B6C|nr:methionine ABC transporter ATP-binding protein MetN [Flavobacterium sp. DG1-102-2]MDV6169788.1 methionine ABC transporter ATP-binding protein MetN [Flavobacterium sp. DG1-102-2]
MIELKNVGKTFSKSGRTVNALTNVSLFVPEGSVFGIIGTSGAGKSTLIRCINLLERPSTGEVLVDGKALLQLSASELALQRRQIGMIFQHFNLLSSRTVFGNVAFPLELAGLSKDKIRHRVNELLELVGLTEKVNEYPASLSGGQKQRVAIARTLANNPKVLLCDEATSALDPATTRSILNLLKDINKKLNVTILLITHQMEVVRAVCDSVAVISHGRLVEQGTVGEVFASPKDQLTREFIASALHIEVPDFYIEKLRTHYEQGNNTLVKLEFTGESTDAPFLTQAAKRFGINANIVSAQSTYAGATRFGVLLVELSGEHAQQQLTIDYFKHNHIKTETLGYV